MLMTSRLFRPLAVALGIAALGAVVPQVSAQITYTFSTESDFTSNFVNSGPGAGNFTVTTSANLTGVGGTVGALTGPGTDKTFVTQQSFNLTTPSSITMSLFVRYTGNNGGGSTQQYAQIGILPSNTQSFNGGAGQDYISVRFNNNAANGLRLEGQSANNGTASTVGITSTVAFPAVGDWLKLTGVFNRNTGNSTYSFTATLENWGGSGTVAPVSPMLSISETVFSGLRNSFFTDTTTFAGVRSTISPPTTSFSPPAGNGQGYLDNFYVSSITAIPEPSTTAAFALGALSLAVYFRIRRRQI